jgi:pSer/pThr/pTyr-binding forkhead associated (FHA) protein
MSSQVVHIPYGELAIGRGSSNQLRLSERSVSRLHTVIVRTQRGIYVRDAGSSLGTYVNGHPIQSLTALRHGDVIRIGYMQEFEFRER